MQRVAQSDDKPADPITITYSHLIFSGDVTNAFQIAYNCATTPLVTVCLYEKKRKKEEEVTACSISLIKGCKKFIRWCYLAQNRITFFFATLN